MTFSVVVSIAITYGWQTKLPSGGLLCPNDPPKFGTRGHWELTFKSIDQYSLCLYRSTHPNESDKNIQINMELGDTQ